MDIKLIVTDIDDTLIESATDTIPVSVLSTIEKLLDKGIIFAVATGRVYSGVYDLFGSLKNRIGFITGNGAVLNEHDEKQYAVPLAQKDVTTRLIEYARTTPHDWIIQSERSIYAEKHCRTEFISYMQGAGIFVELVDNVMNIPDEIINFSFHLCENSEAYANTEIINNFRKYMEITYSGSGFIDMQAKAVNKGKGVRYLQDKYHIYPEQTAVFGDSCNDIPMFKEALYTYSVENAHEQVKKASKYILPSVNENGVSEFLKSII